MFAKGTNGAAGDPKESGKKDFYKAHSQQQEGVNDSGDSDLKRQPLPLIYDGKPAQ